ncbi:hypothetical protein K8089_15665 [Aequorivita sp. F47161]|uniref:Uncharacterized protein n=1 Tax=Aequorivita vitellina TaxID=2874475 RepID=A0A9X1R1J4_9FLAO|nr:hypothetical protein [Aequorivita vitellina]MCG2420464.1 hypothetical protein [Aequorivita vitellina]
MNSKLISSHIIITLISIFGISYLYQFLDNRVYEIIYSGLHLAVILILYIASGILATDNTFSFKKYYIIALIGFIIWLIAFTSSPKSIDYKHVKEAGLWFFYQLYVMGISIPLENFFPSQNNIFLNFALLLSFAIIPSLLQGIGGYIKIKQNKKFYS